MKIITILLKRKNIKINLNNQYQFSEQKYDEIL